MIPLWRRLLQSLYYSLLELLFFFPLVAVPAYYLLPSGTMPLLLAMMPAVYVLAYALMQKSWLRRRFILLLLVLGAAVLAPVLLQLQDKLAAALFCGAMAGTAFLRGARLAGSSWAERFPDSYFYVCMGIYFLASVVLSFRADFGEMLPFLNGCGIAALAATFLHSNRRSLEREAFANTKAGGVSAKVLQLNRVLILLLLAAVALLASWRAIADFFGRLGEQLRAWLAWLFRGSEEQAPPPPEQPPAPMDPGMMPEPSPPAAWMALLERIMFIVLYVALAAAAVYASYRLLRLLPALLSRLMRWLGIRMHGSGEGDRGYVDDVERIMDMKSLRKRLAASAGKWFARQTKAQLSNEEQVRQLYVQAVRAAIAQGYRFKPHFTPEETLREIADNAWEPSASLAQLAKHYNEIRYGLGTIADGELAALQQRIQAKPRRASVPDQIER